MKRIFFFLSAALLLTACSKLTEKNLEKVHSGMTTDEVRSALGSPTSVESTNLMAWKSTTFTYHTSSSDVKIVFVNDRVMSTEGDFK